MLNWNEIKYNKIGFDAIFRNNVPQIVYLFR